MARLPQPGSDSGVWGDVLNDYLSQTLKPDGNLKDNVVTTSSIAPDAITGTEIANGTIQEAQLSTTVQGKLNAVGSGTLADDSISTVKLQDGSVTTNKLADGSITNAKVAPTAAIDQSKVANLTSDLAGKATTVHTHTATQISDATAVGRSFITAADSAAAKTLLGLSKTDVGLGNVDNTSDAAKNSAAVTLTNKAISGASNTLTNVPQSAVTNLASDLASKVSTARTVNGHSLSTDVTVTEADVLPTQTGNAGKYLTTNGTSSSWASTPTKSTLAAYMKPMSSNLYPSSDITSYTISTTAPSYSSQKIIAWNASDIASKVRIGGSLVSFSNNGFNAINGALTSSSAGWTSFEFEFYVNGADFTIWTVPAGAADYRLFVDDMPLEVWWPTTPATVTAYYIKVQFATSRIRKVRVLFGHNSLTGIALPGASDIWAAPKRFRCAVVGDSYISGGQVTTENIISAGSFCGNLAVATGWEVWNMGQGGTGYTSNSNNDYGKDYYSSTSRVNALAALPTLDLTIIYGSGNDSSVSSGTLTSTANTYWNTLKAARPNTPIIIAGMEPGSPAGFNPSLLDSSNATLKAAAAANQNISAFVDMRPTGDNWVTGTGNQASPVGDGNADFFISSDTVHPSRAGHMNMVNRFVTELKKIAY